MSTQNLNLVDKVIELAKKFGSVDTEVVISNISDTTVEARRGNIEFSNVSDNSSISLRVINNKKSALVSTTSEDEKSLKSLVIKAIEIAKNSLENPYDVIAQKNQIADNLKNKNLEIFDHKTDDFSNTSIFEELAITADNASCQNPKISKVS